VAPQNLVANHSIASLVVEDAGLLAPGALFENGQADHKLLHLQVDQSGGSLAANRPHVVADESAVQQPIAQPPKSVRGDALGVVAWRHLGQELVDVDKNKPAVGGAVQSALQLIKDPFPACPDALVLVVLVKKVPPESIGKHSKSLGDLVKEPLVLQDEPVVRDAGDGVNHGPNPLAVLGG
ncbi:hypothetical protein OJ252_3671, partial [Cryptosporidium canis]